MAAITICSDFGAPKNKVCHCFHCLPIYVFVGTDHFEDYWSNIQQSTSQLGFVWCFCFFFLKVWALGRKDTKLKSHSHHVMSRFHTINLAYHCWYELWLFDLSAFSTVKLLFDFLFSTVLFVLFYINVYIYLIWLSSLSCSMRDL